MYFVSNFSKSVVGQRYCNDVLVSGARTMLSAEQYFLTPISYSWANLTIFFYLITTINLYFLISYLLNTFLDLLCSVIKFDSF